jgi:hypothetical protein
MVTALAALLALPARSRAEDEVTTPESRAKKVMAAFPEPSADLAFSAEFDFLVGTAPMGTISFSAAVAEEDGEKVWKFTESGRVGPMTLDAAGICGKDLLTLGGEHAEKTPDGEKHVAWERTEAGYALEVAKGEAEPVEKEVSAPEGAAWSFGGLALFCRMIPAEQVEYLLPVLDPDADDGEQLVEKVRVRVVGAGKFTVGDKSVDSWNCVATKTDGVFTLFFDPARKTLVGMTMQKEGGPPITLAPKGSVPAGPKVDLSKPATTAQVAAVRAALAMTVADTAMLDDVTHWPSAIAHIKAAKGITEDVPEEALKQQVLSNLTKQAERAQVEPMLLGILQQIKLEKTEDGDTKAVFPAPVAGLTLYVREVDGVWKLVRFPDA